MDKKIRQAIIYKIKTRSIKRQLGSLNLYRLKYISLTIKNKGNAGSIFVKSSIDERLR
jgi:hypothetical protein